MIPATISRFTPAFREEVFKIACDTAYFGEPVEIFLDDRRLFFDSFYRYYTDTDNEHSFVALVEGRVVGFVVGCLDTRRYQRWFRTNLLFVLSQAIYGKYKVGAMTSKFVLRMAKGYLRSEFIDCDLHDYPAHLHINLDAGWRQVGIGSRLLERYLEYLRENNSPGVHLHTTDRNVTACSLYEKFGFQILASSPTTVWKEKSSRNITNLCYGLRLDCAEQNQIKG